MSATEWANWASLFWFIALGCYWFTFVFSNVMQFLADPHPSQWGGHFSTLGKSLIAGILFSIVTYFAVYFLGKVLPSWALAIILFLAMLYYGFGFLSLLLTSLYLLPASWGLFGKESKIMFRTTNRMARGTNRMARGTATLRDEQEVNALFGQESAHKTLPKFEMPSAHHQTIVASSSAETAPARLSLPQLSNQHYGWTEFWEWARTHGISDRRQINQKLGYSSNGLTPGEIRHRLLSQGISATYRVGIEPPIVDDEDWDSLLNSQENSSTQDDLPPLDVYNDERSQELRPILARELWAYRDQFALERRRKDISAEQWLAWHPDLQKFLDWYDDSRRATIWNETQEDIDLLIEQYLFWVWV